MLEADNQIARIPMKESDNMPELKEISIKGFKSFRDKTTIELGKLNVLIGANGAGKSNFISVFQLLNNALTGNFQGYTMRYGAEHFLYNGRKTTQKFELAFKVKTNNALDSYELDVNFQAPNRLFVSREYINSAKNEDYEIENSGYELGLPNLSKQAKIGREAKNPILTTGRAIYGLLAQVRAYQFHDTTDTSRIRGPVNKADGKYLKSDGGNTAAVLYALKNTPEYQPYYNKIVNYVRRVMPDFQDFELTGYPENPWEIFLTWRKSGVDAVFSPNQLSDGTIRFIALATLLLAPEQVMPKIIVLDEPELGLHPMAIHILANMIKQASENTQVIFETQSSLLLDHFQPEDVIAADTKDGSTILNRLNTEELSEWVKKYSLSELWDKNVFGGQP